MGLLHFQPLHTPYPRLLDTRFTTYLFITITITIILTIDAQEPWARMPYECIYALTATPPTFLRQAWALRCNASSPRFTDFTCSSLSVTSFAGGTSIVI